VGDELVELLEGAFVEQQLDTFTNGKFAFAMLALAALGSTSLLSRGVAAAQFL
jgi:hypothetical protein